MIFAPRSCPSSPGLAITTRILWVIGAAVYGGAYHRRWLLPRLAEPRQRPFRVPRRRAGPPPRGLRAGRARQAARVGGAVAGDRLDPDLTLASRSLGRSRPLDLGPHVRARARLRGARGVDPSRRRPAAGLVRRAVRDA